jgi:hypothetical protein
VSRPRVPIRRVVLVTGSREWADYDAMARRLERYPEDTLVIHGGARGADEMADTIARTFRMRTLVEEYFGDLGVRGGPARNDLLIDLALTYARYGYTVTVEAFPIAASRGTWDCVNKARNAGLQVEITHG